MHVGSSPIVGTNLNRANLLKRKGVQFNSRKIKERPDINILIEDIKNLGYCGTGRKYNVSDNSIRKWIKNKE